MAADRFVSYIRVSTARQGASGLGIEAQRNAVAAFLNGGRWEIVAEFVEIESGKNNARPRLAAAIAACKIYGARLLIAKLDRLSRNVHFLTGLREAGVRFVAADMPEANELVINILASVAEAEREMISARTKAALAASKKKLGGYRGTTISPEIAAAGRAKRTEKANARAADLAPLIDELRAEGAASLKDLAKALTARGVPTARGGRVWSSMQVSRVLAKMGVFA